MILHNYRRCPFCIRVRIVLELENIPYSVVEERLGNWTDDIKNLPNPCVPIVNIDGELMRESNDINMFLDKKYCDKKYDHPENKKWFDWCAEFLKPSIDEYKYSNPETREFSRELTEKGREKLNAHLQILEDILQNQKNINGEKYTLADFAIIPFVRQIMRTRSGEFDFTNFPAVEKWTNNLIEQKFFTERVMKKHPFAKEKK